MFNENGVCPMPSLTLIRYFYPKISGWSWPLLRSIGWYCQ